jgi:hypothetical protein
MIASCSPLCCRYLQHGRARRFGRLAVVGIALAPALAQAVGVHIVPRRAVVRAHVLEERQRGRLIRRAAGRGEKAAFLFLIFAGGRAVDRAIIFQVFVLFPGAVRAFGLPRRKIILFNTIPYFALQVNEDEKAEPPPAKATFRFAGKAPPAVTE